MPDCKCGGPVNDGDPNGPICTNTGLYVHACAEKTVINARINVVLVEPEIEDLTDLLEEA